MRSNSDIKLSQEEASKVAKKLCEQIDSSLQGRDTVKSRYEMVENIYRCDPKSSVMHVIDGLEPYVFPMYRQKANKIKGTLQGAYFGVKPWVQFIDMTVAQDGTPDMNGPQVEQTFQNWLEASELKNRMSTVFINTVHFNCGIVQPYVNDKGVLCARAIHPMKSIMFPCEVADYNQLLTVGHEFTKFKYEFEEGLEDGTYNKDWLTLDKVGVTEDIKTTNDYVQARSRPVDADGGDEQVICYELIARLKLPGDDKRELYQVEVEKEGQQLMKIKKFPYSRPWYFVFRTSYDEENMYPSDSIGGIMQGLQLAYNDGNTMMLHGSMVGAFPPVFISGGMTSQKVTSYQPGQLIETADDIKVQSIPVQFNPAGIPMMIGKLEELADGASGISRLGTVEALPGHTTATAAQGFLTAQQQSKDEYVDAVAHTFTEMINFCFEMMTIHQAQVAKTLGAGKWRIPVDANINPNTFDLQPTGAGTTTDPMLLGQKLNALYQMSLAPNSSIDTGKVERMIIQASDLPYDVASLLKPPVDPNTPPPPTIQPSLSISIPFESLANPNLAPAQLDVLEHAGIIEPGDTMEGNGQQPMEPILPGFPGMGGDQTGIGGPQGGGLPEPGDMQA